MRISGMNRIAVAVTMALTGATAIAESEPLLAPSAMIDLSTAEIAALPEAAGQFDLMTMKVVAPSGEVVYEGVGSGEALFWTVPANAEEGWYSFETLFLGIEMTQEGGRETGTTNILGRQSGQFRVQGGTIYAPPSPSSQPQLQERQLAPEPDFSMEQQSGDSAVLRFAGAVLDFLVPSAQAQLSAESTTPSITFDDTQDEDCTPAWDWRLVAQGGSSDADVNNFFQINGVGESTGPCGSDVPILVLNHDGGNSTSADSINSIVVAANGDVNLASDSFLFDRSLNRLGIGTTTPADDIEIQSTSPAVNLDAGSANWTLGENASDFRIRLNSTAASAIVGEVFTLEDLDGNVGIWNPNPSFQLDVRSNSGTSAAVNVQNTLGTAGNPDKVMFRLVDAGQSIVRFQLTGGGSSWTFDNNPNKNPGLGANSGEFRVSKVGTGVAEFTVDGFGNGNFLGNSFATNHINVSARASKTDFAPVSVMSVLEKVASLPISQWRYKSEAEGKKHVGPIAEDFLEVFGLGDGKTISTVDASGVALAALKGLHQMVQEKDAEIAEMKKANSELALRLARLEAKLLGSD